MKRRTLIAGNWKMNGNRAEAAALAVAVGAGAAGILPEIAVFPPFLHIEPVLAVLSPEVFSGAQDVSAHDNGAYTGEVSASMLADMGCKYVIVGHSERRQYFEESDHMVGAKAARAIAHGLVPVICVGETLAQRQAGLTATVIEQQLHGSVPAEGRGDTIVVAYEPVWAIGTGQVATTAQIAEVHAQIRANLEKRLANAGDLRIIYGGSVKPENAREILSLENVDGALVGGASLKAESFLAIANAVKE